MVSPIPVFSAFQANQVLDFLTPIRSVLKKNWYILGEEVKFFEAEFATYIGVENCISVANGTDALELALKALDIGYNDKVITVANAGFYSSTAIYAVGAVPLYAEVDQYSLTLNIDSMHELLQLKPRAIIVTHLYGQLANIEEIMELANLSNIPVIEDCAQSHGAMRGSKKAGSFGSLACFSFYPTKNLGALGDGGAIVTSIPSLAIRLRKLRQYGWSDKYTVAISGGRNSRMDELQAAILRVKLPYLDFWNAQRRSIAARYNAAFTDLPLQLPFSTSADYVAHLYVIRTKNRKELAAALKEKLINTDIHYPIADHLQAAYNYSVNMDLAITEEACRTVLTLPCFPGLTDHEVQRVIDAVICFHSDGV